MKKKKNNSVHATALQVALALALVSISAVLLASSFKNVPPNAGWQVGSQRPDVIRMSNPVSQYPAPNISNTGFDSDSVGGTVLNDDDLAIQNDVEDDAYTRLLNAVIQTCGARSSTQVARSCGVHLLTGTEARLQQ